MYDYQVKMKEDILSVINDNYNLDEYRGHREDLEEELNDKLWTDDSVTGNGSGSYTFNSFKAKEYVIDNMDLLAEMAKEYDLDDKTVAEHFLSEDWEYFDVSIRCYLLPQMTHMVLDDLEYAGVFNDLTYQHKKERTMNY